VSRWYSVNALDHLSLLLPNGVELEPRDYPIAVLEKILTLLLIQHRLVLSTLSLALSYIITYRHSKSVSPRPSGAKSDASIGSQSDESSVETDELGEGNQGASSSDEEGLNAADIVVTKGGRRVNMSRNLYSEQRTCADDACTGDGVSDDMVC